MEETVKTHTRLWKIPLTVLIVSIVVGSAILFLKPDIFEASYSILYLSDGDVYVGKLATFPRFTLTKAYRLESVRDQNDAEKSTFQLAPVGGSLWASKKLHIERSHVVFYGPLDEASKVAQALRKAAE